MPRAWFYGETEDARYNILVPDDPYLSRDTKVWINGETFDVERVDRYRDGGTTEIHTTAGEIRIPSKLKQQGFAGFDPQVPTFNGIPIE